jgi:hypothetical protein
MVLPGSAFPGSRNESQETARDTIPLNFFEVRIEPCPEVGRDKFSHGNLQYLFDGVP